MLRENAKTLMWLAADAVVVPLTVADPVGCSSALSLPSVSNFILSFIWDLLSRVTCALTCRTTSCCSGPLASPCCIRRDMFLSIHPHLGFLSDVQCTSSSHHAQSVGEYCERQHCCFWSLSERKYCATFDVFLAFHLPGTEPYSPCLGSPS